MDTAKQSMASTMAMMTISIKLMAANLGKSLWYGGRLAAVNLLYANKNLYSR